jgi:hypothetical protein
MPFSIYSPISTTNPLPVDLGAVTPAQLVPGATEFAVGDLLYADATTTLALLPASTNGYYLKTGGAGTPPEWAAVTGAGVGDVSFNGAAPVDNAIARYDGITGGLIQASGASVDDSGNLTASGTGTHALAGDLHLGTSGNTPSLYSIDGLYFNMDSDSSSTNQAIVFGKDRTATSGGTNLVLFHEDGHNDFLGTGAHTFGAGGNTVTLAAGAVTATGALTSGAPAGGTAGAWKLGVKVDATTALDTAKYLQVDIGGTLYKVALVTS